MNKNGREAAIDIVCSGFKLPADNSKYAIDAIIIAQTTFLNFYGSILPLEVIILKQCVAESADVMKKHVNKQITNTDKTLLIG